MDKKFAAIMCFCTAMICLLFIFIGIGFIFVTDIMCFLVMLGIVLLGLFCKTLLMAVTELGGLV